MSLCALELSQHVMLDMRRALFSCILKVSKAFLQLEKPEALRRASLVHLIFCLPYSQQGEGNEALCGRRVPELELIRCFLLTVKLAKRVRGSGGQACFEPLSRIL